MRSALRTFTSALGVCAACYLLSTASWQQVLLLFMVASFGWSWFAFSSGLEAEGAEVSPRVTPSLEKLIADKPLPVVPVMPVAPVQQRPQPAPRLQPVQRVQRVYRFPIHELTRASLTPIAE